MGRIRFEEIPALLAEGKCAKEIAEIFGVKKSSLTVQCSRARVSLRVPKEHAPPRKVRHGSLEHPLRLQDSTVLLLKEKARQMHIHPATLAANLIETIVEDDLYKAVLDVETA
jgi:hypothetical protein